MNQRTVFFVVLALLLLSTLVYAASFTREERSLIRECKSDCRDVRKAEYRVCNDEHIDCRTTCEDNWRSCLETHEAIFDVCEETCLDNFTNASINATRDELRDAKRELRYCERDCSKEFRTAKRTECSLSTCKRECSQDRRECRAESRDKYRSCNGNCIYTAFNDSITCEDGKYDAGQKFGISCQACECGFDGQVHCKLDPFCNFDNFSVDVELCENAGGYYDNVCKGPFFRLRCSQFEYCQCAGTFDFTCPTDHVCVPEFEIKIPPAVEGFKDDSGNEIGDIGICAPLPELDTCGNGVCDYNITKNGPAPETNLTCPQDCA